MRSAKRRAATLPDAKVAAANAQGARSRGLRFLPRFLFVAENAPVYILGAWLLAMLPSLVLSGLLRLVAPEAEVPLVEYECLPPAFTAIMLIVVAPFLETLIMAAWATILHRAFGFVAAVFGSALAWGIAHSSAVPAWGLVVWWPFLIFTIVYLTWRRRGLWPAIGMATAVHALQNSVGVAGLLLA